MGGGGGGGMGGGRGVEGNIHHTYFFPPGFYIYIILQWMDFQRFNNSV